MECHECFECCSDDIPIGWCYCFFASGEFFQILLLGCTSWYPFFLIGSFHPVNLETAVSFVLFTNHSPKFSERVEFVCPNDGGTHRGPCGLENAPTKCPIEQSAVLKNNFRLNPLVPSIFGGKCELTPKDCWEDQSPPNPPDQFSSSNDWDASWKWFHRSKQRDLEKIMGDLRGPLHPHQCQPLIPRFKAKKGDDKQPSPGKHRKESTLIFRPLGFAWLVFKGKLKLMEIFTSFHGCFFGVLFQGLLWYWWWALFGP